MIKEEIDRLLEEHLGSDIPMLDGEFDFKKISILGLFDFIYALEKEKNIVIPIEKIHPDNFRNPDCIYRMICKMVNENFSIA